MGIVGNLKSLTVTSARAFLAAAALAAAAPLAAADVSQFARDFADPPQSMRPWCYWWWINGHADRETITADLEAMKRLGFGGVLMFDSRGYWDDEDHLVNPKAEVVWGSPQWYDLVEFSIRECARLGLEFTMNASASGGTLNGFIDGKEYETDITDRSEVVAHFDRVLGPLLKRVPDLVGKTFTHIYSVSYEGNVKTGGSWRTIKDAFYATMSEWAHSHGLKVYSESGGPWAWGSKSTKLDCDQLDMLAHNDFSQGEFWPLRENGTHPDSRHANRNERYFIRAVVLDARRLGKPIVSLESFTHMHRHWTVDPAFLKPLVDIGFADGVNRVLWHTFTCSPKKFGVPGAEYFAGSHVNRNVTWHKDAGAFVKYIWRCQTMLQRGEYVDDGEFLNVTTNYYGWGRFRKDSKAQFTTTHRREGDVDWFFVAGEGKGDVILNTPCKGRTVEMWDAVTASRKTLSGTSPSAVSATTDGKTRVSLDLPMGGSCFVVFAPGGGSGAPRQVDGGGVSSEVPVTNPWQVSFTYHAGISAPPPAPVTMPTLRDWTTYGEEGKAGSAELRYFAGTAKYKTKVTLGADARGCQAKLSLGELPTGLAHVFVNGKDCGVVWCAPWEIDVSSALRPGENDIEIRYTNNWANRLVGDCFLDAADRVTASNMRYSREPRTRKGWNIRPTLYSGFARSDRLQPSGLTGPVRIRLMAPQAAAAAGGNEVLVDFSAHEVPYRVASGAYRAGEAERQVTVTAAGLVVRTDADKEAKPSRWMVIDVPASVGAKTDWRGRKFRLVMSQPPAGRARSDIALNFTDADGETFQLMRGSESYGDYGEFYLYFDMAKLPNKGWGGRRRNGEVDGRLRFSALNVHFSGDKSMRRGEVEFCRIEGLGVSPQEKPHARGCVSREQVSVDTMYPGAKPFPGAEELEFTVTPPLTGTATLRLSYGSTRDASRGIMTNLSATVSNGLVRVKSRLPYDIEYEYMSMNFAPAAGSPKGPFKVVRGEGVFRQTAAEAMRLRVETGNPLHLVRDESERPSLVVSNPAGVPLSWSATFVLEDIFGSKLDVPFNQTVPAGGEVRVAVPWPLPAKGLWRVHASVAAGDGSRAEKRTRFAYIDRHEVTPIVDKPKFRMGIHYHGTRYWPNDVDKTISAMVWAGAKFTRTDYSFMWGEIERKPGEYDWEKADVMLRKMRDAGLSLDIIFAGAPWWAVEQKYKDAAPEWKKANLRVRMGVAPTRPGLFRDFCEKLARRYGKQIDYYETGNEWDLTASATFSHDALLRMQREAYEGVHAGCADACVIPNGWTRAATPKDPRPATDNIGLIEAFVQHPEWYDAWALHCHGAFGGFRERIVGEFLPLREGTPLKTRPWLLNETALTSAHGQEDVVAATVWRKILFGWGHGARDYIWYNLRATGWFEGGEPGYGLITADYYPRAGYAAFAALSTIFQGLDADGILHSAPAWHLFRFKGESKALKGIALAGWGHEKSDAVCNVVVETDAERAETSDIMGNRTPVAVRGGKVSFIVGKYPKALLLHGATKAKAVNPEALDQEHSDTLLVHRRNDGNKPHIVLADPSHVHDRYEADPAMAHRLWKGPNDNSALIWFNPGRDAVRVKIVVVDDVDAPGDKVEITVTAEDGTSRSVVPEPSGRTGGRRLYEFPLPLVGEEFMFDVKVHDDDGEGEDSYLFLREPGASPLQVRFAM